MTEDQKGKQRVSDATCPLSKKIIQDRIKERGVSHSTFWRRGGVRKESSWAIGRTDNSVVLGELRKAQRNTRLHSSTNSLCSTASCSTTKETTQEAKTSLGNGGRHFNRVTLFCSCQREELLSPSISHISWYFFPPPLLFVHLIFFLPRRNSSNTKTLT